MKVTTLPYIPPRKVRKQESLRFVVKWTDGSGTVYMQWFKRDTPACNFMNQLIEDGYQAKVLMV